MTNEEAIPWLKGVLTFYRGNGYYDTQRREALKIAIKALERPHGECRTCKYYHPYFEKFSNDPRGDGYCVIARMTPEGMTTINCNDEFSCSDYQKIEGGGA